MQATSPNFLFGTDGAKTDKELMPEAYKKAQNLLGLISRPHQPISSKINIVEEQHDKSHDVCNPFIQQSPKCVSILFKYMGSADSIINFKTDYE
jgi:hypothetical protein